MKKTTNIPKETNRMKDLPECWVSDQGKYIHCKNSKMQRRLPVIGSQYEQILNDMNVAYREIQKPTGKKILQYWDKKVCIEYKITLPLYEKKGEVFIHTRNHTDRVQGSKMLSAAFDLQKNVEKRRKEVDEAEQAKRNEMQKQKYEEVQAKLQADEDLAGVSFVSTIVPNFGNESIKVFNLPKVIKDKKYPSYYYAAFDTTRIGEKTVITLEVPNGKIQQYLGKKQENVISWAKELGVRFISVVEETAE